jgi:hypothetical protein
VLVAGLFTLVAAVLTMIATDELWAGREPGIGGLLGRAVRRSGSLLVAYLLAGVVVALGVGGLIALLLVARLPPAVTITLAFVAAAVLVFASIRLTPIGQVIVLERVGGLASFRRAWALTAGVAWRILGLLIAIALLTLPLSMGAQLMSLMSAEPVVDGLAAVIATMVTTPLLAIATTLVWADLAGRPQADNDLVARGRGRGRAVALVVGLGIVLAVAGVAGGADTGFAGLLPDRGVILAGTGRDATDPCRPTNVGTRFRSSDEIWVGGYFLQPIPPGRTATIDVSIDNEPAGTTTLTGGPVGTACYYEEESLRGSRPGSYRIEVRLDSQVIAQGSFVIEP